MTRTVRLTARFDLGAAYDILDVDADFALNVLQQGYAIRAATRPSLTSFAALLSTLTVLSHGICREK